MTQQQTDINYDRIKRAINFIAKHLHDQPSLEQIVAAVHVSPYHFQRMFLKWAGVNLKKFAQFLSLTHANTQLRQGGSLLDAAHAAGLSGGGRLHDLFVSFEAMTPGAYKRGGAGLLIDYGFAETPFGQVIVASTPVGICHMAFAPTADLARVRLYQKFPVASLHHGSTAFQQQALMIFSRDLSCLRHIKLHLQASRFQIKTWEALLKIPMGAVASYGDVARHIGQLSASRAVATAVASNPVALLTPCDRVIRQNGVPGGCRWGEPRKSSHAWLGNGSDR